MAAGAIAPLMAVARGMLTKQAIKTGTSRVLGEVATGAKAGASPQGIGLGLGFQAGNWAVDRTAQFARGIKDQTARGIMEGF